MRQLAPVDQRHMYTLDERERGNGITFHKDISHVWFSVYPSLTEVERVTTTSACRLLWASYNMLATGKALRDLWEANLMPCKLIWRDPPVRSQ